MGQKEVSSTWQVRQTELQIDLRALKRNLKNIYSRNRSSKIVAVLKSDAYGHGAVRIAQFLESLSNQYGVHGFGVANVEEGLAFRKVGIKSPVYILSGIQSPDDELFRCLLTCDLTPVVGSLHALKALVRSSEKFKMNLTVHLKFDTGMNRLGFRSEDELEIKRLLDKATFIRVSGLMSHFAASEKPNSKLTKSQIKKFRTIVKSFGNRLVSPKHIHMANSGASQFNLFPEGTLTRVGIQLYGAECSDLAPIASWLAQVYDIKSVKKGETIGYGPLFTAKKNMQIAILGVGYADGYRRAFSNKADVLLHGKRCRVVGAVSMDLVAVDVTGVKGVTRNSKAVLLGRSGSESITAEELARFGNCISYEIFTGISPRVPRSYIK